MIGRSKTGVLTVFRKSAVAVGIALLTLSVIGAVPTASAANNPYKNCKTFHAKYPKGIARSTIEATAVASKGYEQAKVNRRVYAKARKANKRLGTPADGVICEVPLPVTAPSEVRNLTARPSTLSAPQTSMFLSWEAPASDGNSAITAYQVSDGTQVLRTSLAGPNGVVTTYLMKGLSPGATYTFTVTAINEAGEGPAASVSGTTEPEAAPTPTPTTPSSSATRYSNCTAAKAAGVTPIRRDTNPALYAANTHLDRDKDGVACE